MMFEVIVWWEEYTKQFPVVYVKSASIVLKHQI